jgi:thiamine kinase-like enzyme
LDERTLFLRTGENQAEILSEISDIVSRLEPILGEVDGDPVPLDGGITNRNFRTRLGNTQYVIRVPGKDTDLLEIDRFAELAASELAAEAGVAPRVAAMLEDPPCLVAEFIGARTMESPELRSADGLTATAEALRKIHDATQSLPSTFSSFRIVETYAERAADRGVDVPADYEWAKGQADRIEAALDGPEHDPVPCHNDLLAANFLHDGDRLWIVDWEYAGMGNRYFDLGNFSVNNELGAGEETTLLAAYFGDDPGPDRLAALALMRFMSDFREAMWGVLQSGVSELDFDFTGYAAKHFARLREATADPRFEQRLGEASHDGTSEGPGGAA